MRKISKEILLDRAWEIVLDQGLDGLSMRNLAKQAEISVGSVYNYFPNKKHLLLDLVDAYWRNVFYEDICKVEVHHSFLEFSREVYQKLYLHNDVFQRQFMAHLRLLDQESLQLFKAKEHEYFKHIFQAFLHVLKEDKAIDPKIWTQSFTPDHFVGHLMSSMFSMLVDGQEDFSFMESLIVRLLYKGEGI